MVRIGLQLASLVGGVVALLGLVGSVGLVLWGIAFTSSEPLTTIATPSNWIGLALFAGVAGGPWLLGLAACLGVFVAARKR